MVTMVMMMIKCNIVRKSDTTYEWTLLIFLIFILNVDSFNLKCPSQANWKFRANVKCNSTLKYFCLFNNVDRKYVEGCDGPDWDRKGSKRIFAGYFTREQCIQERFQPIKFRTNESMSDCIYAKSLCSEEGQIVEHYDSTKDDRTCRCDYKNSYSYIKTPRNLCSCIPTQEDCSCYIKTCPVNLTLSPDYVCIQSGYQGNPTCIDMMYPKTLDEKTDVIMEKNDTFISERTLKFNKWTEARAAMLYFCFCFIFVASGFTIALLFSKRKDAEKDRVTANEMVSVFTDEGRNHESSESSSADREQRLEVVNGTQKETDSMDKVDGKNHESYNGNLKDTAEQVDATVHQPPELYNGNLKETVEKVDATVHQPPKLYNGNLKDTAEQVDATVHQPPELDNGNLKDTAEKVDATVHQPPELFDVTRDEVYYLRIMHLLFRIACPVVRMIFDDEIQPKQLRKTLNKNKLDIELRYRKKETIINDVQWNLLFGTVKGKPVTSNDFDIRLMINLLSTIAKFKIGDLYPVPLDTSISAMLSKIKYIRNDANQSIVGKLQESQFKRYWDDIGQAILTLISPHIHHIKNDKEKKLLIDRLFTLNPFNIDKNKLSTFIEMSEIKPLTILRSFISDYCALNKTTLECVLKKEKHQLYHKRHKTRNCCSCKNKPFTTFIKVLPEKHWSALYDFKDCTTSHSCPFKLKTCYELIVPKKTFDIDKSDVSVAMSLILYIPGILKHFVCRLCANGFDKFLMNNQHTLYHSMNQRTCCKCSKNPTEKQMISDEEWNKMFLKDDNITCKTCNEDCCCQYSVIKGIKYSDIDEILLSKVFYSAGPFGLINKIGQDAFSYFLSWTVDDQPIRSMLTELLNVLSINMVDQTSTSSLSQLDESTAKVVDAEEWISKHLRDHKLGVEPTLQMLVLDHGCLKVRGIQIPKDFISFERVRKFEDITSEENNFLVVVHTLKAIVHPVIKKQLHKTCTRDELLNILMRIYYGSRKAGTNVYLSERRKGQIFSPINEDLQNLDLKVMIYILTQRTGDIGAASSQNEWKKHLNAISEIRREIMQSSSGVLEETRFQDLMNSISKAVLHLEGDEFMEKLSQIQNNKKILE